MSTIINVNNSEVVKYTNKLDRMRKYDLPLAVRGTLNKAAFNVKQVTMPVSADKHFEKRKPNFFKANSRVKMADGFRINEMRSVVGFTPSTATQNNKAVVELEEQEYGGQIGDRSYVPLKESRIGESDDKMVSAPNRIENIPLGKIIHAKDMKGSRKQKYLAAAIQAGKGGYITSGLNKKLLRKVISIRRKNHQTVVNSKPLYSYKENRSVRIKSTSFMREASLKSAGRLNEFYIAEAKRRFGKMVK